MGEGYNNDIMINESLEEDMIGKVPVVQREKSRLETSPGRITNYHLGAPAVNCE